MEKIALITDTASDLSDEMLSRYNIKILPFRIIYKDKEYKDRFEIKPQQVYDNFVNEIPTTSLPSVDDMEKLYKNLGGRLHPCNSYSLIYRTFRNI
jgi:fatty acid-binding protein DegV